MPAEEMLAIAKCQLEQMCFIGITERLEESVALACRSFGRPVPPEVEWQNIGTGRLRAGPPLSDHELALLRRLNEAEYELYDFANRLFADAMDSTASTPTGRDC